MLFSVVDVEAAVVIDGIHYELADGNAIVTKSSDNILRNSYEGDIVIPSTVVYNGEQYTVVGIDDYAFYGCENLQSVTIPNTVTSLGYEAFSDSKKLTSVNIPASVTLIASNVFKGCTSLVSVTLPNKLTSIGDWVFSDCSSLTTINFPNSVTRIGKGIFNGCTSLPVDNGCRYADSYLVEVCDKDKSAYTLKEGTRYIGYEAFRDCKKLLSITIPNTVLDIGEGAFENCVSLASVTIPDISKLSNRTFRGCTSLKSFVIPNSVESIGDAAFSGCTGLSPIVIPNSVCFISWSAFDDDDKHIIYCYPQPYFQLKNSNYKYKVYLCGAPVFYFSDIVIQTQSTISCLVYDRTPSELVDVPLLDVKKMKVYVRNCDNSSDEVEADVRKTGNYSEAVVKGLKPHTRYNLTLDIEYSDGTMISSVVKDILTYSVRIRSNSLHPTSVSLQDVVYLGDAGEIKNGSFTIDGKTYSGMDARVTGLTPGYSYNVKGHVSLSTGYATDVSGTFTTPALELTTLAPKGVSSTCSIVAAKTNISDDETSVGFQWRKSDAPETMIPKEGYAAVYGGQMEGYIKNLQPASYYNVRPFYKSEDGKYYYGEWVTFDPSDFSFFEPTVHTYAVSGITDNAAVLSGYALAGTDDILEQGFEYWAADEAGKAPKHIPAALVANSTDKITITAAGQKMHATIDGLKPETNYSCRAYVRTSGGTVYGESQSFTTDVSSGISTISRDADGYVVAVYDVSGRKLNNLQRGINVVKYSDGTMRKINVK